MGSLVTAAVWSQFFQLFGVLFVWISNWVLGSSSSSSRGCLRAGVRAILPGGSVVVQQFFEQFGPRLEQPFELEAFANSSSCSASRSTSSCPRGCGRAAVLPAVRGAAYLVYPQGARLGQLLEQEVLASRRSSCTSRSFSSGFVRAAVLFGSLAGQLFLPAVRGDVVWIVLGVGQQLFQLFVHRCIREGLCAGFSA